MSPAPKSLQASSVKYGPCEVCGKPAAEVFITAAGSDYVFGHKECLR